MKLNERLKQADGGDKDRGLTTRLAGEETIDPRLDPLSHIKTRAQAALFAKLGSRLTDASIREEELQIFVAEELSRVIEDEQAPLTTDERKGLATQLRDDILGYGPIQDFLDDHTITEVMVNAADSIYIERDGHIIETEMRFSSRAHLRRVIDRIVAQVGRRIDESSPMVDASRTVRGSTPSSRRFRWMGRCSPSGSSQRIRSPQTTWSRWERLHRWRST